jgi:hypothetical protein
LEAPVIVLEALSAFALRVVGARELCIVDEWRELLVLHQILVAVCTYRPHCWKNQLAETCL